ncbi:hypothetical protein CANTEDRAFT_116052 [Yamadazyma tenuis ATCC 10573]|uniref:Amino acid transporter transmembrane domain-containing protein n=2 Tax=Candida tenuis (strain ATCC 10573 / BCRC 21748 / CBS 615 / JCM 9827 / NBRC 10315 / NRRL Y-1498 / VKM Y-70) TaxID=590646 RepID=G3BFD9_CANTC|nr:uncharacterized protein CANTEDRAFT_116052 [Yamadazyma tenuis ATCC 10573]EGV60992.1 hypothetical protein CANTEDRAFT_116052 [Yamadazyma tenuis ATCC 10573]
MSHSDISPPSSYQELSQIKGLDPTKLRRSSSFSTFLDESRRNSTASDINIPGGFRRQYIINQSIKNNRSPPKFLTNNLIEFLNIYSNFAGEDLSDDEYDSYNQDTTADEESLLLPEEPILVHQMNQRMPKSNVKTYFLVFKALVGSGILFLPKAFSNGGLIFSIITLNIFGVLTFICYMLLIVSKNYFKLGSFGELGFQTYGSPMKVLILISILISQIGFVSTYILFTTSNMASLFHLSQFNLVVSQFILLIPLVLIRKIGKLSFISLVSSVCILIGLVIIFYYSISDLVEDGLGPNIIQFNSNSWSMLIGVAVTSFEGIGLILPIEASMSNPKQFPRVLATSMIAITLLFTTVGVLGYLTFGDKVETIILLNLPYTNISIKAILILYSVAVFLTAPLQLFPAIKILENVIFNSSMFFKNGKLYNSGKFNSRIKWLKNIYRVAFLLVICIVAYCNFDNIDKFVSFNGCFACIPLVYIYPPLIHLKTLGSSTRDKIYKSLDYTLAIIGVVVVIYSTYQILFLN